MEEHSADSARIRERVERCLLSVLPAGTALPGEDGDWIESGLLDSMGLVEVLVCIETAINSPNLFDQTTTAPPTTIRAAVEAIRKSYLKSDKGQAEEAPVLVSSEGQSRGRVEISGWGVALGSERITADQLEREFSLPPGTLAKRAGIETIRRVSAGESEVSLARAAAEQALHIAGLSAQRLDWIIGTSETLLGFPSLAASMHTTLLAPGTCRVLDVGGACVGLVNCLAVAKALFAGDRVRCILLVSADAHSRILVPGRVPGEFGGLFGDGASAFVLRHSGRAEDSTRYSILASIGSCAGTFSSILQLRLGADGSIELTFDGDALAHAAVDRIERIISDLEAISGIGRERAGAFAIHQPNPRIVEIILGRTRLPPEKVPQVARSCGNLGSSTCGVALSMALDEHNKESREDRGPIFVAAVGPGMLWGGTLLV